MGTKDATELEEESTLTSAEGEESGEHPLAEIYKSILTNDDIILIIDKESEEMLRKGLIALKYKANKAAAYAGLPPDKRSLEFQIIPWSKEELIEDDGEYCVGKIKIQMWLKAKQTIRVHRIIITDKEF